MVGIEFLKITIINKNSIYHENSVILFNCVGVLF